MSSKGYSSQQKLDRLNQEFPTVEPVREEQQGLSVTSHMYVTVIAADAVEAGSTKETIIATGNVAKKGDVLSFTSGAFDTQEVKVWEVDGDDIILAEDLASAPAPGDTFDILRHKYPVVGADGNLSITASQGPVQYVLDGVDTEVSEDTVVPGNSTPLPVKLMGTTGPINITAGDLNVHLSDSGGNPDRVLIGDGVDTLAITGAGQAEVILSTALPAGNNNIGDVDAIQSGVWNITNITGTVSLPTGAATEATLASIDAQLAAGIAVTDGGGSLTVDGTVTVTDGGGSITVDGTVAATQSGTWNINDITGTVSLPTGAATEATLSTLNGKFNTLGQKTSANSAPVVLASDQSAIPVTDGGGSLTIDGTVAVTDGGGSLTVDGTVAISNLPTTVSTNAGNADASTLRVVVATDQAVIPVSDNGGSLTVDGTVAATQSGTWTVAAASLSVVDLFDTPLLDTSSVNIPGSGGNPVSVVASLAANSKKMQILDTTGAFIGLYTGAALSEVLQLIIGPGSDQTIEHALTAGVRVSLKRLDSATAVSSGIVAVNFIG